MRKKITFIIIVFVVVVFVILAFFVPKRKNTMMGTITYHYTDEKISGTAIHNLETYNIDVVSDGDNILWLNSSEMLICRFNLISRYNIETKEIVDEYYMNLPIDFFTLKDKNTISISFQNNNKIVLFDMKTKEQIEISADNGSTYHGWDDSGNVLFYSNQNNKIVCYDIKTGEKRELFDGREPLVKQDMVAYIDMKGNLCVRNIEIGKCTIYDGNAYYYCFSPHEPIMLIEDEISTFTGIKNLLLGRRILGHSIVAWNYENNDRIVFIDACNSGTGKGFSWK